MNYTLSTLHFLLGVPAKPSGFPLMYRRKILRLSQKDAASIPNALAAIKTKQNLEIH